MISKASLIFQLLLQLTNFSIDRLKPVYESPRRLSLKIMQSERVSRRYLSLSASIEGCGERQYSFSGRLLNILLSDCSRLNLTTGQQYRDLECIVPKIKFHYTIIDRLQEVSHQIDSQLNQTREYDKLQYWLMFNLISKTPYSKETISNLDKFYRLILNYDGSVSKFIQNLSGESLIVRNLHHTTSKLTSMKGNALSNECLLEEQEIYVRYVELRTKKLEEVVFAKSYWSQSAYNTIMAKNPSGAIGLNLISQQVEQFRRINWMGQAVIKLDNGSDMRGLARSYSIISGNRVICEIEEYFTPHFNKLFY